jgi:amino-acid N-acetyltransferase
MAMMIESARAEDVADVLRLLETNHLPTDGLTEHWPTTIVARDGNRIVGSAALEVYADGALLRSVAVDPSMHGRGLGGALVAAALDLANRRGIPALYLLTTTAEGFFPRFGFTRITRGEVPPGVQQSVEFTSACPASAVVMRRAAARS